MPLCVVNCGRSPPRDAERRGVPRDMGVNGARDMFCRPAA